MTLLAAEVVHRRLAHMEPAGHLGARQRQVFNQRLAGALGVNRAATAELFALRTQGLYQPVAY
jgi:hypothetical protein